ncbi:MAG: hypothetical protein ACP5D9_13875 [Mariniphaga sp.]
MAERTAFLLPHQKSSFKSQESLKKNQEKRKNKNRIFYIEKFGLEI